MNATDDQLFRKEVEFIAEELQARRDSWLHRFDGYVSSMAQHCSDTMRAKDLVRYAEELANLTQEVIDRRKAVDK